MAIGCSAAALIARGRLNRGYLGTLENSLADLSRRAGSSGVDDAKTTVSIRPSHLLRGDGLARTTLRLDSR